MEAALEGQEPLNVEALVIQTLIEQLGVDASQCTPEATIVSDLGADSLDAVQLMLTFEELLSIEIDDDEAVQLQTVGQLIQFLKERVAGKAAT